MLAKVLTITTQGIEALLIDVETDLRHGLPQINIVGLAETTIKESKERVQSAIINSSYKVINNKITINLAPADIRKEGVLFDLPIATSILAASKIIKTNKLANYIILGELSLSGEIKAVKGVLSAAHLAKIKNLKGLILPYKNAKEASLIKGIDIIALRSLSELVEFANGKIEIQSFQNDIKDPIKETKIFNLDFADVKGQENAKRAMKIAAAGKHNALMIGAPGSGKTMIAKRVPYIMPPMSFDEIIESTKIFSIAGLLRNNKIISTRPFRSPHHTISDAGLIGGGANPKPGEISLSNNGILFLDEFAEFKRNLLEMLRQPLEDKIVTISRALRQISYPSNFLLIAAMNPCPCGYYLDEKKECVCSAYQIQKYRSKISGPLLDRIDLFINVPRISYKDLKENKSSENSEQIFKDVMKAQEMQKIRFKNKKILFNSEIPDNDINKFCHLEPDAEKFMQKIVDNLLFSARSYKKLLKVSRTIADLEEEDNIKKEHLAEAFQYKNMN